MIDMQGGMSKTAINLQKIDRAISLVMTRYRDPNMKHLYFKRKTGELHSMDKQGNEQKIDDIFWHIGLEWDNVFECHQDYGIPVPKDYELFPDDSGRVIIPHIVRGIPVIIASHLQPRIAILNFNNGKGTATICLDMDSVDFRPENADTDDQE
jgi:hypothetical protein